MISKRPIPIDPAIPLTEQVQITTLPGFSAFSTATSKEASPYEFIRSILHNSVQPYFNTFTKGQQSLAGTSLKGDNEARSGIPAAQRKFRELDLTLSNLGDNVEIPQLLLPLHPLIKSAVESAEAEKKTPSPDYLPASLITDITFLNGLQATVNGWIKSIQTITKTNRQVSTGTATQEINFWLSMENRLDEIETQLKSPGVKLTLDVLKNAKRFQATVSFSADTGLKEAHEKVIKYNQLMREFPIGELLSATSLHKVEEAIHQIFTHLNKKLRICPYPVDRALPLVEAISADLDKVLHDLLRGKELMAMDYPEFKSVMEVA